MSFLWAFGGPPAHAFTIIEWDCPEKQSHDVCAVRGGLKSIYIYGNIERIDAARIASVDGMLPPEAKLPPVYINSEGGSVEAAQWIGRILRRRQASIEGKDVLSPDNDASCFSACVLIALGATTRQFRDIGVHLPAIHRMKRQQIVGVEDMSDDETAVLRDYLTEMGAPAKLRKLLEATPHHKMAYLTYDHSKPRDEQEIVQLGFRMRPDDPLVDHQRTPGLLTLADNEQLLQQGARSNDIRAMRRLGEHYFYGSGEIRKNTTDGLKYLHRAADAGDSIANFMLGNIYFEGRQQEAVDKPKAYHHFLLAARAGNPTAQAFIGRMRLKGDGISANLTEAVYWATRAAEQGEPHGYALLAHMRLDGQGFELNDVEAYIWLRLAIKKFPACKERERHEDLLKSLTERMTEEQRSEGDRRVRQWTPLSEVSVSSSCDDPD